jgi:hypothetical protein
MCLGRMQTFKAVVSEVWSEERRGERREERGER